MNSRERILAMIDHLPVDRIPLMPITMMFAADQIGVTYGRYVSDHKLLVEPQLRAAEKLDFDLDKYLLGYAHREAAEYYLCGPPIMIKA